MQEVCNALFDALFEILPLGARLDETERTPAATHRELPWDADAQAELERIVASRPVLVRISAAKELRDEAEARARRAGDGRVAVRHLTQAAA